MTEAEIRADERRKIAAQVRDFSWILPLIQSAELDYWSDLMACEVGEQIADWLSGDENYHQGAHNRGARAQERFLKWKRNAKAKAHVRQPHSSPQGGQ